MVTAMSRPYLYAAEHARLILAPDGQGRELQAKLRSAGIASQLQSLAGVSSELLSFDGDPEVVRALLERWKA